MIQTFNCDCMICGLCEGFSCIFLISIFLFKKINKIIGGRGGGGLCELYFTPIRLAVSA